MRWTYYFYPLFYWTDVLCLIIWVHWAIFASLWGIQFRAIGLQFSFAAVFGWLWYQSNADLMEWSWKSSHPLILWKFFWNRFWLYCSDWTQKSCFSLPSSWALGMCHHAQPLRLRRIDITSSLKVW
jgi:hypothetical protein